MFSPGVGLGRLSRSDVASKTDTDELPLSRPSLLFLHVLPRPLVLQSDKLNADQVAALAKLDQVKATLAELEELKKAIEVSLAFHLHSFPRSRRPTCTLEP